MIDSALVMRALHAAEHGVYVCDPSGVVLYVNPGFLRLTGYTEAELLGQPISLLTSGKMPPDYHSRLRKAIYAGAQWREEIINRRKDGTLYHAFQIITPVVEEDGTITAFAGIQHDITDAETLRKQLEDNIKECDAVFSNALDALFLVDVTRNGFIFRKLSRSHEQLTGLPAAAVVGKTPHEVFGAERGTFLEQQFTSCVSEGTPCTYEESLPNNRILETKLSPIYHDEMITQLVGSTRDVTRQKSFEHELRYLAEMDMLTNIPNRRKVADELDRELSRAQRHGHALAVLLIDVDHFKQVNDDLGHESGDAALRGIAATLQASLRPSDRVGRWGGEEFVALLPETGREGALIAAERIRRAVEEAHIVPGRVVTVSIGFSAMEATDTPGTTGLGHSPESLIRVADEELYRAKESGRNRSSG
ncbi:MAG: diguanylate cyclase [Spirochaeta sp.]|jgi:diguanylate cyclase (GGDEF)-like protein/PAS domain S-box-containing protein|nr:diguanylate cyclase [Spirochaeta sp.]